MKIVAVTDIHSAYKKAEQIIRKETPDVLIIGGDLTTVGSVKEAEEAIRQFQTLSSKVLCVAGNMDLPQHDELFVKLGVSINGRGEIINNVGFFGVSASPISPLLTPYEISEEEIARRIQRGYNQVKNASVKIFAPHAPPYGTKVDIVHSGIHAGSTAVRDFIENEKPDIVVCGHIHEARGQDTVEGSKIVNCGPASNGYYVLISLEKEVKIMNLHLST
ncbi:MAG: metallophosphoesterase [Ignavibacteriae bacterium]|nr:metallophosphoesterase [Ignavibacteriota bacterium]